MNKITQITTDSSSDLNSLFEKRDIGCQPLYVTLDDKQYLDGVDIDPQMIFAYYEKTGSLPKTAARSIEDFYDFFKSYTDRGLQVVHVSLSSKISSTYDYALQASKRLDGVYVLDSLSLSSGTGLLALAAADMADEGKSATEIFEALEKRREHVQASFMINTLDFLYKGGRCSGLAAFFGKALSIKPTLQLIDGNITVARKFMGRFDKNILKYVDYTLERYNKPDKKRVFITHTYADTEVVEKIKQRLTEYGFESDNIIETIAGSTITSHCGKSTLGILYINDGE